MKTKHFQGAIFLKCLLLSINVFAQTVDSTKLASIIIVPKLDKPKKADAVKEKDFAGYLLVYFKDQNQSAYLAVSQDGYTFTDINQGQPIFIGSQLAEQKGVRDPHITRGPDGAFYLAMTDLHIFGNELASVKLNGSDHLKNMAGETTVHLY